jgi:biopolymer transport protein TolR
MSGGDLGSSGGRRYGGGRGRRFRPSGEVNVTPLVDVMMVLLIIFMISAPMMTAGVKINLPQSCAGAIADESEPLVISINRDSKIYLQETQTPLDGLTPRLQAITRNKLDTKIFIRADKDIEYGKVMEVMGMIAAAGFSKIALISEHAPK